MSDLLLADPTPQPEAVIQPDNAVVGALETAWSSQRSEADPGGVLLVDLSECRYVDIAGLVFLVARLRQRRLNGLVTTIRLPTRLSVTSIIRQYGFGEAVFTATNRPFES